MTEFPDYHRATNAAYETLIQYKEFCFPVGVFRIFNQLNNVKLYTYNRLAERFGVSLNKFVSSSSNYGYNIFDMNKNRYIVAYNSDKDETTIRFTLAHELGHIVLGHTIDGEKEDKEANCFARNLLCPIPAIKEMNLRTVDEYIEAFNVSEPMAYYSIQHVNSDYYYITKDNYNDYNDRVYCYLNGTSLSEIYGIPYYYA